MDNVVGFIKNIIAFIKALVAYFRALNDGKDAKFPTFGA